MKKQLLAIAVTALATGTNVCTSPMTHWPRSRPSGSVTLGVRESSESGLHAGQWQVRGLPYRNGRAHSEGIQKQLGRRLWK